MRNDLITILLSKGVQGVVNATFSKNRFLVDKGWVEKREMGIGSGTVG